MDSNPTKTKKQKKKTTTDLYDLNFVENEEWFEISR